MKGTVKESSLDKADELMEDLNENMDMINEMNEAMSPPTGNMLDDDELEAELAELEEMEADDLLEGMQCAPTNFISLVFVLEYDFLIYLFLMVMIEQIHVPKKLIMSWRSWKQ